MGVHRSSPLGGPRRPAATGLADDTETSPPGLICLLTVTQLVTVKSGLEPSPHFQSSALFIKSHQKNVWLVFVNTMYSRFLETSQASIYITFLIANAAFHESIFLSLKVN